jgi:hypothetical protein
VAVPLEKAISSTADWHSDASVRPKKEALGGSW